MGSCYFKDLESSYPSNPRSRVEAARIKLVLRLAQDQRQLARLLAQLFQGVAVVVEQRIAVLGQQRGPGVGRGDGARLVVWWAAALVLILRNSR